ncbi:MAG TPA: hypothetical protein PLQ97_06715 [Myxococcota bacterium]|nr:hypothetical protein [Myxococcota bacterium]HQK50634.1 hypothetical protein [Myxococcota bacterium]
MRYTTVLVTSRGPFLLEGHRRRIAPEGPEALAALDAFLRDAAPGVYGVRLEGRCLVAVRREGTALRDGIPTRLASSPVAGLSGPLPKPPSPGPYDAVRLPGVVTLLTDPAGTEVWEACRAAVVSWDGRGWVVPPRDRPAVDSVALAALRDLLPLREAPIPVASRDPLVLINAVAGVVVPAVPGRDSLPGEALREIRAALDPGADRADRIGSGP